MATLRRIDDNMGDEEINQFNLHIRQQPWYQDWFRAQGLNPDKVKLSKQQRAQLEQLVIQNAGVNPDAFNDMMIDPAGNLNSEHGFASLPTWAKVAIGAAAAGGGYLAAPYVGSALGMGGGGVPNAVPAVSGNLVPTVTGGTSSALGTTAAGSFAPAATKAATGSVGSRIGKGLLNQAKGLDYTALALGGLSMLGEDEGDDPMKSMRGTTADPVQRMTEALDAVKAMTSNVQQRGATRQRRPDFNPPAPIAVDIPGIPFQIGGGLGRDPAIAEALKREGQSPTQLPDLFGGAGGDVPASFQDIFPKRTGQKR
jgi:hypothetical protein